MRNLRSGAVAFILLLMGMGASAQTISIQVEGGAFKVAGWKAPQAAPAKGWQSIFAIYAGAGDVPALLGTYSVEGDSLVFHPTYPLAAGVRYRAVLKMPGGGRIEQVFDGPRANATPSTRVLQVYPSGDVLPSNELKLYIYFSAPMSRGEADARIHLLDENGKILPDVFLPGQELWDRNNERLTVIFDPGRIKTGLTSNQKMGLAIMEGKRYTLLIDRAWKDARDVPMVASFRRPFRGGPAQRIPPDPKRWSVTAPKAGTRDALSVSFHEPMDYALLQRMLEVSGGNAKISGSVSVGRAESEWSFIPDQPWKPGNYSLVVNTELEDLAGNHIGEAFDIDTFAPITEHITTKTISLPFEIH